jgi:predicted transcriptional regulator
MNKEEKIGMYTREEILDYMQDCEGSMLGRSMYDAIMSKIDTLQSQLDIANKKLDKIKEYCNNNIIYLANSLYYHNDTDVRAIKQCEINGLDILSIIGGE